MEKPRYQWGAEKKDDIAYDANRDIKPKDGVVVVCRGLLDVGESLGETAALKVAGNEGEDGEHSHNTIVVGRQHTGEEDAEHKVEHLHRTAVECSPKQSFGCLFFQVVHLLPTFWLQN